MHATTSFHLIGAGKDDDGSALQFDIHFGPDEKVDGDPAAVSHLTGALRQEARYFSVTSRDPRSVASWRAWPRPPV